jgi:hypothetical protein
MRGTAIISLLLLMYSGRLAAQDSLSGMSVPASAPTPDVIRERDTLPGIGMTDSVRLRISDFPAMPSASRAYGEAVGGYVEAHPYFPWLARPVFLISREHPPSGMDWLFYTLLGSLAFFGILRRGFARYVTDLAVAFFGQGIRQAPIREQLARQALPAQLMNLQFLVNVALFGHLLAPDLHLPGIPGHWAQIGALMLLMAAVYVVKGLTLWVAGFLAGRPAEAEGYLFIVMMVNKVTGVALIPLNILLAYLGSDFRGPILAVVLLLLSALFLLRLLRCYDFVSRELRIGFLPFLLFLTSFEVMPMLVLGKALIVLFP